MQSAENRGKKCHRFWLRLRNAVILISNDRTSTSNKINEMTLIRTLMVSTTAYERTKEKFYGFRQTEMKCQNLNYDLIRHSENKNITQFKLSWNEVQAAVPLIIYCTAALASLSDSVSYITFLFSEWLQNELCFSKLVHFFKDIQSVRHSPWFLEGKRQCQHWIIKYLFGFSKMVQKNRMIQMASSEPALTLSGRPFPSFARPGWVSEARMPKLQNSRLPSTDWNDTLHESIEPWKHAWCKIWVW